MRTYYVLLLDRMQTVYIYHGRGYIDRVNVNIR